MEKLKVKHDHTLTDIIKVGIFALFLILPILVFLPNCLYYGFNEHATNETTTQINYKYQSNEVNTVDDLVEGNIYFLDRLTITQDYNESFYCDFLDFGEYHITGLNIDETFDGKTNGNVSYEEGNFYMSVNNANINIALSSTELDLSDFYLDDFIFIYNASMNYVFTYRNELPTYTDYNVIESVETNVDNTITQSVSIAWQRMWETPMLNWTSNNTFQFTINAFTNIFGITPESKMANYLTYLLVITCIYLIFDIVLTLTTKLTHLINAK